MKRALVLAVVACAAATGCSTTQSRFVENSWQGLNIIDAVQTDQIAREPGCYHENDFLTSRIIGSHPSRAEAAAVMIGYAYGHKKITEWLDRKSDDEAGRGWKITRAVWHTTTFAAKSYTVSANYDIGLWPGHGCQ